MTHVNLNDDCVEGMRHVRLPVFSVQYHPEAAPGPHDAAHHFRRFIEQLEAFLALEQRGHWCAVGLVDITSFKWYNDTLGHALGDRIMINPNLVLSKISPVADWNIPMVHQPGTKMTRIPGNLGCIKEDGGEEPAAEEYLAALEHLHGAIIIGGNYYSIKVFLCIHYYKYVTKDIIIFKLTLRGSGPVTNGSDHGTGRPR